VDDSVFDNNELHITSSCLSSVLTSMNMKCDVFSMGSKMNYLAKLVQNSNPQKYTNFTTLTSHIYNFSCMYICVIVDMSAANISVKNDKASSSLILIDSSMDYASCVSHSNSILDIMFEQRCIFNDHGTTMTKKENAKIGSSEEQKDEDDDDEEDIAVKVLKCSSNAHKSKRVDSESLLDSWSDFMNGVSDKNREMSMLIRSLLSDPHQQIQKGIHHTQLHA
jgi:hypothetical protein